MLHLNVLVSRSFFLSQVSLSLCCLFCCVYCVRSRKAIIEIAEHLSHAIQTRGCLMPPSHHEFTIIIKILTTTNEWLHTIRIVISLLKWDGEHFRINKLTRDEERKTNADAHHRHGHRHKCKRNGRAKARSKEKKNAQRKAKKITL